MYPYNRNNVNEGGGAGAGATDNANVVLTHRWVSGTLDQDDTDTMGINETMQVAIGGLVSLTHGLDAPESSRSFPAAGIRGSYHGVDGNYLCVVADGQSCSVEENGGYLENTAGDIALLFRADDPDIVLGDQDYLVFGVWTEVPDNPTLANPGRVRPFVNGSAGAFDGADFATLSGGGSYSGKAVGHWATRAQGSHMADAGRFTADAAVTAGFADGGVSLSGSITKFVDEADEMDMAGWLVNLNGGALKDSMIPHPMAGMEDGNQGVFPDMIPDPDEANILGTIDGYAGSRAWEGAWEAQLFGTNKDTKPTGVAGSFVAFGGTPQPVTTPEARIDQFHDQGFAGVVGAFAGR